MAKTDSLFNFTGSYKGTTRVRSKTYGDHIRAARGTHSPATLNEAMIQSGKRLVAANAYAKIIKDCLDPYRTNFRDGTLWSRLVSHFRQQMKEDSGIDFRRLEDFQLYKAHPLDRIVYLKTKAALNTKESVVTLKLKCASAPVFKKKHNINSCHYTVIGIFIDEDHRSAQSYAIELSIPDLSADPMNFVLPVPEKAGTILVCVKCEGCRRGVPSAKLKTKGMCIVKAVNVADIIK